MQYFPKGTDFNQVSEEQVALVMKRLNQRPRKTRGYRSPIELFLGQSVDLLTQKPIALITCIQAQRKQEAILVRNRSGIRAGPARFGMRWTGLPDSSNGSEVRTRT